jgi:hypothetical protein
MEMIAKTKTTKYILMFPALFLVVGTSMAFSKDK